MAAKGWEDFSEKGLTEVEAAILAHHAPDKPDEKESDAQPGEKSAGTDGR